MAGLLRAESPCEHSVRQVQHEGRKAMMHEHLRKDTPSLNTSPNAFTIGREGPFHVHKAVKGRCVLKVHSAEIAGNRGPGAMLVCGLPQGTWATWRQLDDKRAPVTRGHRAGW